MEIKMRLKPGGRKIFETITSESDFREPTQIKPETELESRPDNPKIKEIFKELDDLIGLNCVKKMVYEVRAFIEIQKFRTQEKLVTEPMVLHAVFKGNPGTGKTTVARIVAKLFKELGVIQKGHLVEVERADLVGEYIGHTAQKTREQLKKAMGGVLFIDEAYSLARGGEKDFGKEAIDVLVKAMEDEKDSLILILAGYKDEMEYFLRANPGLRSRFPLHIDFPDYRIEELIEIAQLMVKARQYQFSEEAQITLERVIQHQIITGHEHSGNARLIRNLIESCLRQQAVRLINKSRLTRNDLIMIESADVLSAIQTVKH